MWALNRLSIRSRPRKLRLRSFSDPGRDRMNMHKNARMTPIGRERLVQAVVGGPTPAAIVERVEALRRQRFTGKQIAANLAISPATVSRILRRLGLNRMRDLEPAEPVRRYEREHPGDMIHIDIKKLGRFDKVGHRITGDRTGQSN